MDASDIRYILALTKYDRSRTEFSETLAQLSATTLKLSILLASMRMLEMDLQIRESDLFSSLSKQEVELLSRGKVIIETLLSNCYRDKTRSVATTSGFSITKSSAQPASVKESTSPPEE